MLMQIRERASGIVAYIIVILIAIPFAFWGIQEYFSGPADQNVAVVDGNEIKKRVFDNQVQEQKRYLKSLLGNSYNALYEDELQLKKSVLDNLIQTTLLNEETRDAGYRISNAQLFQRIKSAPQFQSKGRFDQNRYEQFLATQQRNKIEFEEQLRQEERVNQYRGSVVFSGFLPSEDKTKFAALKSQKRDFDYFIVEADVDDLKISEEDITNYYNNNTQTFKTPARVKLEYIEIDQDEIAGSLEFGKEELLARYEEEPDRYRSAELRSARHILFKLDENAAEEQVEEIFARANEALDRINKGEDFAAIAREISEDTVSSSNGGALGFLSRTDIDNPAFISKLFAMKNGQISEPIKTKLGVQIVKLEAIMPSELKPFAEVKSQIENELKSQSAEKEFVKRAERLQELSYENEDSLDVVSEDLGVAVHTSDWISSAGGTGIGEHAKVISAAFSDDVLEQKFNSELLELTDGRVAVVRVLEYEEATTRPLEDVSESIKTILSQKHKIESSLALGKKLVSDLQSNPANIAEVAKDNNSSLQSPGALSRDDDSAPREILAHTFKMPIAENEQPVLDGFQLRDGRYAIVRLNRIEEVKESGENLKAEDWVSEQGKYGRRELTAMMQALKELRDVEVFPEQL